jgi:ATP-dependent Clp protease ATP-binding subunit ClpX
MEQEQNPPFPSPEELKSKLTEFMKSNFGDRIAFTSVAQPDMAETGEKAPPEEAEEFEFNFLPRDIKAHLDRFVIKQDEAKKLRSLQPRQLCTAAGEGKCRHK